jgi:hypothetical protein
VRADAVLRSRLWLCGLLAAVTGAWLGAAAPGGAAVTPPDPNRATPVQVRVFLEQVGRIDPIQNTFWFHAYASFTWTDPRLAFDPAERGTDEEIHFDAGALQRLAGMWWPMPIIANQVGPGDPGRRVLRIRSDGQIRFEGVFEATVAANYDLRRFPFDRHALEIDVESFRWSAGELRFVADREASGLASSFAIPEWRAWGFDVRSEETAHARGPDPFSRLVVGVRIGREIGFYVWKVVLPLFVIVAISWSVFWMTDEHLSGRARVVATGILTVVAYQFALAGNMPRVAYLTLMDAVTTLSFSMMGLAFLQNMFVVPLRERDPARALALDRTCRWAFPLAYAIGLAALTAFYLA